MTCAPRCFSIRLTMGDARAAFELHLHSLLSFPAKLGKAIHEEKTLISSIEACKMFLYALDLLAWSCATCPSPCTHAAVHLFFQFCC